MAWFWMEDGECMGIVWEILVVIVIKCYSYIKYVLIWVLMGIWGMYRMNDMGRRSVVMLCKGYIYHMGFDEV